MEAKRISWKSTYPMWLLDDETNGIEYRVYFGNLPEYLKTQWLEKAKGICLEKEIENPMIEMEAILTPDKKLENVSFRYYFTDYEYFELSEEDEKEAYHKFIEYVLENGENIPDAYDCDTDELMGSIDWEEKYWNYISNTID